MKHILILLVLLPTFLLTNTSMMKGDPKPLKIGKKAPLTDLKLKNVDGKMISLAEEKMENGLVVVFSCNTCPFVVGNDKFPGWERRYNALYEEALNQKLGFVLVNSNEAKRTGDDSFEAMKQHAADRTYKMHYLLDENSKLANAFGARTTPHVYVFDKEFKLVYAGSIDNSWDTQRKEDQEYLVPAIQALSKNEKIIVSATTPRGCSIKRL